MDRQTFLFEGIFYYGDAIGPAINTGRIIIIFSPALFRFFIVATIYRYIQVTTI